MKSRSEITLDWLWRFARRLRGVPMPSRPARQYPNLKAKAVRKKINYILDRRFSSIGFTRRGSINIWLRKKSNGITDRLAISTIERLLPTYFGIEPIVGVCAPQIMRKVQRYSERKVDLQEGLFVFRLEDFFPRKQSKIAPSYDLRSFESMEKLEATIEATASSILECADRFYPVISSYQDLLGIYRDHIYPWGNRPPPFLTEKEEILGILLLKLNGIEAAREHFKAVIEDCESRLMQDVKPAHKKERLLSLLSFSRNILDDLDS